MRSAINETRLGQTLKQIFPGLHIERNGRKYNGLVSPATGRYLEVDYCIQECNLAFEFQENHHFEPSWFSSSLSSVVLNDNTKKELLTAKGNTLLQIPWWWDGTSDSLVATILQCRPDLAAILPTTNSHSDTIPSCIPSHLYSDYSIPHIGKLMFYSFMKPVYAASMVSSKCNWWFSESHAGVRACWVVASQALYSHRGTNVAIPSSFINELNKLTVDTEGTLWMGRRSTEIREAIYNNGNSNEWCNLRFMLQDCPSHSAKHLGYEERYKIIFEQEHSYGHDIPFNSCLAMMGWNRTIKQMIHTARDNILTNGGNGLLFIRSASSYVHANRDSNSMLILKVANNTTSCDGDDDNDNDNDYINSNSTVDMMYNETTHSLRLIAPVMPLLNGVSQRGLKTLLMLLARRQEEEQDEM